MARHILCATTLLWSYEASAVQRNAKEDLVVTAQFRSQPLLDVPIALTAYDRPSLEQLRVHEFADLARFVPGFVAQNQSPNNPGFALRGITADTGEAFEEPRVSIYQDGLSIARSRASYVELLDIERIEVARGPQSALYGRAGLIGAVNIIQAKPDLERSSAYVELGAGNERLRTVEAMINQPLDGVLGLRIAGRLRERSGTVDNLLEGQDYGSTDTMALRMSLAAERPALLRIDLIGNYQRDSQTGTAFRSRAFAATDPVSGAVLAPPSQFGGAALSGASAIEAGRPLGLDRDVGGVTGIVNWTLGSAWTLHSVTGWRAFRSREIVDADGIALPLLTGAEVAQGEQWSTDVRLRYEGDGPMSFSIGAAWLRESGRQRMPLQFDERTVLARTAAQLNGALPNRPPWAPAPLSRFDEPQFTTGLLQAVAAARGIALAPSVAAAIAGNLKPDHLESSTNLSRASVFDVFADGAFPLGPNIEFLTSLRYTLADKRSGFRASILNGRSIFGGFLAALGQPATVQSALLTALARPGAALIAPSPAYPVPLFGLGIQPTAGNGATLFARAEDDGLTWRAALRHVLSPHANAYASYARGRRPRVLAARAPMAPEAAPSFLNEPAETVDSYELGAKIRVPAQGLTIDGALFHYRYANFQTLEQQGVQLITTNAGEARAYGVEGQVNWQPSSSIALFATYAFNHSRFEAGARKGNRFRLAPDHSGAVGITLRPLTEALVAELTGTLSWQSKIYFDDDNDRIELQQPPRTVIPDMMRDERQNAYALANIRAVLYPADRRWQLEAFVRNVFDKRYLKDAGNTGDVLGMPTFITGEPRLFGIAARMTFGAGNP